MKVEITNMETTSLFKDRLKKVMIAKGIYAADISSGTGIPRGTLRYYLSGKSSPKADRLSILAQYLNVSESYLLGYSVSMERAHDPQESRDMRIAHTSNRLSEAMTHTGKTLVDLVHETGLGKGTIRSYLTGKTEPKTDSIQKLAVALNVSEMWLWGYNVPMERLGEEKDIACLIRRLQQDNMFQSVVKSIYNLDDEKLASIALLLSAFHQ